MNKTILTERQSRIRAAMLLTLALVACCLIIIMSNWRGSAPTPNETTTKSSTASPEPGAGVTIQTGDASWYALQSATASGEHMTAGALTAAHRSLPLGTRVVVENLSNGRTVVVRITDRGPFVEGRIIDLSKAAAERLDMLHGGTATVRISGLQPPKASSH